MDTDGASAARTVILIHGLWLTSNSWDAWVQRYSQSGYHVIAPAWPGMDVDVESLRRDPSVMNGLGLGEVADHYAKIVRGLQAPPIIMGHSFGGLLVQILLDRGLGIAGVAIHPAPMKGVLPLRFAALRSAFPVLRNPASRRRTVALSPQQWHYAFTNTLNDEESRAAYDRYHVPAPGRPLWQAATANLLPNPATKVNRRNSDRAPLLLMAGTVDHTVPAALVREAVRRYRKSNAVTDYREYPGRSHFTVGLPGWETVADDALEWAGRHASLARPSRASEAGNG